MNIEETLRKLICWEDIDTFLLVGVTEEGKIEVSDYQNRWRAEGDSFEEAVFNYHNDKKNVE